MTRRWLARLVLLVAVLAGLDRGAAYLASQVSAARIRTVTSADSVAVVIRGFPFLSQLAAGDLRRVDVVARGVTRAGLRVARVSARLSGVHVDLNQAVHGTVNHVRVDSGTAQVFLSFADLAAYPRARSLDLAFHQDGRLIGVTGRVQVLGQLVTAAGSAALAVSAHQLVISPVPAGLQIRQEQLPGLLAGLVARLLVLHVNLSGLPFGVVVQRAVVTPGGVLVTALASGVTLSGVGLAR